MSDTNLIQITYLRLFNCYLVVEDDGLTLVDTCPGGAVNAVLAEVASLGKPVRRIVLTHAHTDHMGGLDELVRRLPGEVEVIFGEREAALIAGDMSLRDGESGKTVRSFNFGHPDTKPTRLINDGDLVGSLRAISTPGHSPGHLSLIDTRDATLIAGDAVTTIGRLAVSGEFVWQWPFPAIATWNSPRAMASARTLVDARPSRLATGHGRVLDNATERLTAVVAPPAP